MQTPAQSILRVPLAPRRAWLAVLLALGLVGCPAPPRAPPPAPGPDAVDAAAAPTGSAAAGRLYHIDADASLLTIVALRGGTLAKAGHNHVIASRHLIGTIEVRDPLGASSIELRIPVALLTIDEPGLRAGRGEAFPPEVPESARDGTRRNLLSDALLDAERFPGIAVRSVRLAGGPDTFEATLEVALKDGRHVITAPVEVSMTDADVRVRGATTVRQSDLGLTPFSVMLGALQVQDALGIEYSLVATRARAP